MPNDDPPTSLRYWRVWVLPMVILTITAAWLGMILSVVTSVWHGPGQVVGLLIVGPLFVIAAGAVLRAPFLRLTLGSEGVCAHNFTGNHSVAWEDLAGLSIRPFAGGRGGVWYVAELQTKSGRSVPVRGLTSQSGDVLDWYASQVRRAAPAGSGAFLAPLGPDESA